MKYPFSLIPLLSIVNVSCLLDPSNCICTTDIKHYSVHILNTNHQPIDSLLTWTAMRHSGIVLRADTSSGSHSYLSPGEYIVLTDEEMKYFSLIFYEPVVFHASNSKYDVTQQFVFYIDDCQCHLYKFSGPDTIILQ